MRYFARSASLTNYIDVARSVGIDHHRLLREAGISRAALLNPDLKVPVDALARLLEASAQEAKVEDFGLRMAETRQLSNLGPVGLVLREQASLRRALDAMMRYQHLQNEALLLHIEEDGGLLLISSDMISGRVGAIRQGVELAIGVLYRTLRLLLGPAWKPRSICFHHDAPQGPTIHHRFFDGVAVEFRRDFDGLVCDARDLDRPMAAADPLMARYVDQYLASVLDAPGADMRKKVWQLVGTLLPSGHCSAEQVAQNLGVDRRTVHRHLREQGENFTSLVQAVRLELATRHLLHEHRRAADVALLLGFSSQSAFSRWFSAQMGCSISAWRAKQRA